MKVCAILNIAPAYRKAIYELMQRELDIDIYFGDHSTEGIALLKIPSKQQLKNVYRGTKLIWQRKALRRAFSKSYDAYILTGNAGILSNWLITFFARLLGRKVYLWSHGLKGNESLTTVRKNMLYLRLAGNALLYGEQAQKRLAERGFHNTTVIYNSLDYDKLRSVKVGDGIFLRNYFGNDLPTICYLGRLTKTKKLDLLLRAMRGVDCNLVIVGGGVEEGNLKQLSDDLEVSEKVWFYGESYDDIFIGTLISNCVAVVNPSSVGLTAIHSLMFGTPVITHNNLAEQAPEAEALIEGKTGYYFEADSVESLAQTISEVIKEGKNGALCHNIIDEKYNPKNQIDILKKLLLFNRH